jgi:dihydropteroate synthase
MGIVNASGESFSEPRLQPSLKRGIEQARRLVAEGAQIIDIGGESASVRGRALEAAREIELVAPLVERVVEELGVLVSVDTYKVAVARAALDAGAAIINDVSGLREEAIAELCAERGAGLVIMHTRAAPKQRLQDRALYADVSREVHDFLAGRMQRAGELGVRAEQILLDPGPDFAKTPHQTVELLRGLAPLHGLGRPVLMAISRKDFIGALTARSPAARLSGTLAALAHGADAGAHVFRVHDVAAAADFLKVRGALRGELAVPVDLALPEALRYEE